MITMSGWGSDAKRLPNLKLEEVLVELERLHQQNIQLRQLADELRFFCILFGGFIE
jgi:hypothetical protein